jgi:acetyl-CoA carboxylase biotin carboxylase subunit
MKEPTGPGLRHDCGVYSGYEVSVYYDPILSKLIAYAQSREICCRRMAAALANFPVLGIKTDIEFLRDVITHPEFMAGNTFTDFIARNMPAWKPAINADIIKKAAVVAAYQARSEKSHVKLSDISDEMPSPWETLGNWHIGSGKI